MNRNIASPKVILIIMDGWGYSEIKKGNAILQAKIPAFDYLWNNYPHTLLQAFGINVGLPWGAIGSSEVGHLTIGSGKTAMQEYSFVEEQIGNQSFFKNEQLLRLIKQTEKSNRPLHLIGLLSDGGTHSHINHLFAILELLKTKKFTKEVFIHVISDGRDSDQKSLKKYIHQLQYEIDTDGINAKIASVIGRYYAMDRDNNWDRILKAYDMMTKGVGEKVGDLDESIDKNYIKGLTDEFFTPMIMEMPEKSIGWLNHRSDKIAQNQKGLIQEGDGVLFYNIRADRMRQLVSVFTSDKPEIGSKKIKKLRIATMTTYDEQLPVAVIFPSKKEKNPLAKILSDHGLTQGHFAETEKYAHVTYFFDGGNNKPFKKEEWCLTNSPKVATFDLIPEMSADKITDNILAETRKKRLDFVLVNYANADMVGHTGKLGATIRAVETIDNQLKRIYEAFPDSTIMITADHGNAECKINPYNDEIQTDHTANPVPFILINNKEKFILRSSGCLADIAPTILNILGISVPVSMDGVNLIAKDK
jgi:2,3-bisphosphoglycerate-independent phosphoglycerate mutase